jgi:hypothetical protein
MNYTELKKIKETVEVFEDAEFVSIASDESIIIKNTKTNDLWSVDFSFNEDEGVTLHGETAILEEESYKEDLEKESDLIKVNGALLMAKSDDNDEAYQEGLEYLSEAIVASYNSRKKTVKDFAPIQESAELSGNHTDETLKFARNFEKEWEEKVFESAEKFDKIFNAGFLFEADGTFKYEDIIDPLKVIESYSLEKQEFNEAMLNADSLISFSEALEELDVPSEVATKIDPTKKNWKIKLTEALVHSKQEGMFEGKVSEVVSQAEKSFNEIFDESMAVHSGWEEDTGKSSNGEDKMTFLKSGLYNGSDVYSQRDLEKLLSDLNRAQSTYISNGFSREEMADITEMKNSVDKMYRTAIVSDEEVSNVITKFNSKYGVYKKSFYEPLKQYVAGV